MYFCFERMDRFGGWNFEREVTHVDWYFEKGVGFCRRHMHIGDLGWYGIMSRSERWILSFFHVWMMKARWGLPSVGTLPVKIREGRSFLRCISTLYSAICCVSCMISSFWSAMAGWDTTLSVWLVSSLLSLILDFSFCEPWIGNESVGPLDFAKYGWSSSMSTQTCFENL